MQRTCSLVVLGALCALAPAQIGRKATKVGNASDFAPLAASSVPGSVFASLSPAVDEVQQIQILPDLDAGGARRSGFFQLSMTVTRGGGSGSSLLFGILDTNTNPWTFTENSASILPAGFSTAGHASASMTPDLLILMTEDGTATWWSVRSARTSPFQTMVNAGLASPTEPHLFTRDGRDYVGYTNTPNFITVVSGEIDRNRYPLTAQIQSGFETLVPPPFLDCRSPSFLLDNNGEGRATIHSADMGGPGSGIKARPWFNAITRVGTSNLENSKQFHTGPADNTEMRQPGAIAGTTFYPTQPAGAGPWAIPKRIGIVASSGDAIPATGGTFRLSAWLPYQDSANWAVTILIGTPANDLTVPGFRGKLALQLGFFALTPKLWSGNDLSQDWVLPAPAAAPGTPLWAQTLAFDPSGSVNGDIWYFGNTAPMTWF